MKPANFFPNKMFLRFVAVNDRGYIPYSCLGSYLYDYLSFSPFWFKNPVDKIYAG
jgi:hypothetical protein